MAQKKSKTKVIVILSLIAIVILVLLFVAQKFGKKDDSIAVQVEQVSRRTIVQTVTAIGKIQPKISVKISSEVSGEIISLPFTEGDTVKKGDLVARIQPDLVQTQLAQSKAGRENSKTRTEALSAMLERARLDLERGTKLYKKDFISKEAFDRLRTGLEQTEADYRGSLQALAQAEASYKQAKVQASRTAIYSPINGIVTSMAVERGEKVVGTSQMHGTEMMQIADLSVMTARVEVDENDVVLVSVGDTAYVEIDAFPERRFLGEVYQIANSPMQKAGSETVDFEVRIRLLETHPRLRPGMSCNTKIVTETRRDVLAVPLQSVTLHLTPVQSEESSSTATQEVADDSTKEMQVTLPSSSSKKMNEPKTIVFINDNLQARMVEVKTGISDNGYIEIIEGVKESTSVISGSFKAISKDLQEGSAIRIDSTRGRFTRQ
jgi:HlyD family secretion protein